MKLIERAIVLVCQAVMWLATSVIFVILSVNTILRYSTGSSLQWGAELPELLFPWLVMAGVVLGAAHGAHITTTFLVGSLRPALQRVIGIVVWLAVAALYGTLAKATWSMLDIVADEKSPILGVPGSVTYGCVMGGMVMLSLLALASAWEAWRGHPGGSVLHGEPAPEVHAA